MGGYFVSFGLVKILTGHSVNHSVICSNFSSTVSGIVDGESLITMDAAPIRSSTSGAPVCLAALIARAISACVMVAGRRDIRNFSNKKAPAKRG